MNIAGEINEVIRRITTSGDSHQVVLERAFDTEAADLWDACTSPERLSRWFEPVRGDLVLGGRYTLTTSGTEGDILRCEPGRNLAITWEYQGDVSRVDVDLIPAAKERTVFRVTHHVPPGDHWETYGPAAAGVGWEEALRALSLYLAGDARCAPDDMEEFASTPEGQDLTRRAANAWGWVDREAGTPAGDAETRALRTAAFYLGSRSEDQSDG
ncbi:MAG TPA: SRPBCC domain-containing protein [Micropruina sp.]|nr:SRPBCC domain-containing protein [Micropruina sp.]HMR22334.1 SRPBCC domain-containing protein [Micropruina sp.]